MPSWSSTCILSMIYKTPLSAPREKESGGEVVSVSVALQFSHACVPVSPGAEKCVRHTWEHDSGTFHHGLCECKSLRRCVCAFSCVSMHNEEVDICISSWLHFPGLSLMALCSRAELFLSTYFMTSCAHATLLLLNNITSPLSTVWRVATLTLSAFFTLWIVSVSLSYCTCFSILLNM